MQRKDDILIHPFVPLANGKWYILQKSNFYLPQVKNIQNMNCARRYQETVLKIKNVQEYH